MEGEAQKSQLFWRFSEGVCFSQDRLFSRNSTRKPLNLIIKSPILTNTPCKSTCLYNAPSMHTVETKAEGGTESDADGAPQLNVHLTSDLSSPPKQVVLASAKLVSL